MDKPSIDTLTTAQDIGANELTLSLRSRKLAAATLIALAVAGCSVGQESNDDASIQAAIDSIEQTFEATNNVIVSDIESIYGNLPSSSDPDVWAQEAYGVLNVVYNENRPDLFRYVFGGEYYDEIVKARIPVLEEIAYSKEDPSKLDDYTIQVEVIDERTNFENGSGIISVRETRNFKWATSVAVIDLPVGLHNVAVTLPSGETENKELLLIEGWLPIDYSLDRVTEG